MVAAARELRTEAAAMRLLGKTVRGFHSHDNLQILSADENRRKGNRHWPDQP